MSERDLSPLLERLLCADTLRGPLQEAVRALVDRQQTSDASAAAAHQETREVIAQLRDELGEARAEVERLRAAHEAQIGALAARIEALEARDAELRRREVLSPREALSERCRARFATSTGTVRRLVWPDEPDRRLDDYVIVDLPTTPFSEASGGNQAAHDSGLSDVLVPSIFAIQRTPVTTAQWLDVMDERLPHAHGDRRSPAGMTLLEAILFCNRLSVMDGLTPCYEIEGMREVNDRLTFNLIRARCSTHTGYRLPTDLEWEAAARAGSREASLNSDGIWCRPHSGRAVAVGQREPNALGLHDVLGNIAELVWSPDRQRTRHPDDLPLFSIPPHSSMSARGGSFKNSAIECRFASRNTISWEIRWTSVGLRPVRTLECLPK